MLLQQTLLDPWSADLFYEQQKNNQVGNNSHIELQL